MKQTTTNSMGTSKGKGIRNNAIRLFMVLAMSGTTFTYAQKSVNADSKPIENSTINSQRNPGGTTPRGNVILMPLSATISTLTMLDMGWDKAILTWDNTANFDSIIFRYAISGSPTTRTVGISGNPNPERYILTGLTSQTSYDIEVSTVSGGVTSIWTAPITVMTQPEPAPRLANNSNTNLLTVNPSPASTLTDITFIATGGLTQNVTIMSQAGRIVYNQQITATSDKVLITVNVTNYPPGVYIVRVKNINSVSIERFIKL